MGSNPAGRASLLKYLGPAARWPFSVARDFRKTLPSRPPDSRRSFVSIKTGLRIRRSIARAIVHDSGMDVAHVDEWFVAEVLPLEGGLTRYLRRNWRDETEIPDLRQEIYVRLYERALRGIPAQTKAFLFMTARNLLIDKVRRSRVVCIEAVSEIETFEPTADDLTPERIASAREELRRLQSALDLLPPRCREVVSLRKIEGLSQREVAARLGIREDTVEHHVGKAMRALADALNRGAHESKRPEGQVMVAKDEVSEYPN